MIQRIQTIHLLLSVICSVVAMLLCQMEWGRIAYVGVIALGAVLAAWSIFLYKNRKRQIMIVNLSIAVYVLSYILLAVAVIMEKIDISWFSATVLMPAICIFLNFLAFRRIRFDENLVRSADRLR